MEALRIIGSLIMAIGAPLAIIAVVFCILHQFFVLPRALRGHYVTALVWSALTVIVTGQLMYQAGGHPLAGYLHLLAAGAVVMSSWAQWIERKRGETLTQQRRPFIARLYSQTLWGPVFLWAMTLLLNGVGQRCFESAVARRDLSTALLIQKFGSVDANNNAMTEGLWDAVQNQDADTVASYLAVGSTVDGYGESRGDNSEAVQLAVQKENAMITELLLDSGARIDNSRSFNREPMLITAIEHNQPRQVQTLLRHGVTRDVYNSDGRSALNIARGRGYKEIVAILEAAGKKGTH